MFTSENERFRQEINADQSARIYRSSFGLENDRFRENKPKTLVFNRIRTQRRLSQLVLDEISARIFKGVVFTLKTS
jgi:hypothetical protein